MMMMVMMMKILKMMMQMMMLNDDDDDDDYYDDDDYDVNDGDVNDYDDANDDDDDDDENTFSTSPAWLQLLELILHQPSLTLDLTLFFRISLKCFFYQIIDVYIRSYFIFHNKLSHVIIPSLTSFISHFRFETEQLKIYHQNIACQPTPDARHQTPDTRQISHHTIAFETQSDGSFSNYICNYI